MAAAAPSGAAGLVATGFAGRRGYKVRAVPVTWQGALPPLTEWGLCPRAGGPSQQNGWLDPHWVTVPCADFESVPRFSPSAGNTAGPRPWKLYVSVAGDGEHGNPRVFTAIVADQLLEAFSVTGAVRPGPDTVTDASGSFRFTAESAIAVRLWPTPR